MGGIKLIILILAAVIIAMGIKHKEVPKGILEWVILLIAAGIILE